MLTTLALLGRLIEYETSIAAIARREIGRWATAAAAIPNPTLRRLATEAIAIDASNAEAAAAFAVTAPRHLRNPTIELLVAQQILLDYVDVLSEQIADIQRGLAISGALPATIRAPASVLGLDCDDGGYLIALMAICRRQLRRLPSASAVEQLAEVAAMRCAEALAHTHTVANGGDVAELRRWATTQAAADGYAWWEVAAGGNSNLALLALLAAAADPATGRADADKIASAYWPHVCVMSTLLDSLVDYERDATCANLSFVSHYPDARAARDGLTRATQRSLAAVKPLRRSHAHTMIVCGVAGYYAASAAPRSLAAEVAPSVVAQLGRAATPIVLALRRRHRHSCRTRPVRSRTAAFLTRSRGSVRGPGGSGSPSTNRDGTGDCD
jgi:tetraprenyl-beta-curcumene synthase